MKRLLLFGFVLILMYGCGRKESDRSADTLKKGNVGEQIFYQKKDSVIIDCNYTFEEATEGSGAPKELLEKLALYEVTYYSTDGRLHLLTAIAGAFVILARHKSEKKEGSES